MASSASSVSAAAARATTHPQMAWLTLGVVLMGTLVGTLGNSMANVALPSVMSTFNIAVGDAVWMVTIYILMFSVPMPVFGRLGDLHGYKRLYIISLSLFALFSLLAGLAPNYPQLLIFRALQGLANAPTLPAVMGILALTFPPEQRGQAVGMWAFANSASHAIGPPLSGFLVQLWGWSSIFLVLVPVTVLAVVLIARLVPNDSKQGHGGFDYAGAGIFMLAMLGLMAALTQGPKVGWTALVVLVAAGAFVIFVVLLVLVERRTTAPFIEARLFRNRQYAAATGVISLQVFLQFGLALALPLFLVQVQKQSSTVTGLVVFSLPMMMALAAPFAGRLADRRGHRTISFIGMVLVAIAAGALVVLDPDTPIFYLMAMLIATGIGMGFVQSPTAAAVTHVAPPEKLGVAMGLFNMIRFMGGMLGTTIFGIMLAITTPYLGPVGAFRFDFAFAAIIAGCAALLTFALPGKLSKSGEVNA